MSTLKPYSHLVMSLPEAWRAANASPHGGNGEPLESEEDALWSSVLAGIDPQHGSSVFASILGAIAPPDPAAAVRDVQLERGKRIQGLEEAERRTQAFLQERDRQLADDFLNARTSWTLGGGLMDLALAESCSPGFSAFSVDAEPLPKPQLPTLLTIQQQAQAPSSSSSFSSLSFLPAARSATDAESRASSASRGSSGSGLLSMLRTPAVASGRSFVRGSTAQMPFLPGGLAGEREDAADGKASSNSVSLKLSATQARILGGGDAAPTAAGAPAAPVVLDRAARESLLDALYARPDTFKDDRQCEDVLAHAHASSNKPAVLVASELPRGAETVIADGITADDVIIARHARHEYSMSERAWVQSKKDEQRGRQDRISEARGSASVISKSHSEQPDGVSRFERRTRLQQTRSRAVDTLLGLNGPAGSSADAAAGAAPEFAGIDWVTYVRSKSSARRQGTAATSSSYAVVEAVDNTPDITRQISEEFADAVPNPILLYPFELDNFQKRAVMHLERNESVFVSAHTSAGKTLVAEYAIALSHKHMTRTIYTSPIKALSNQKFRDFSEMFDTGIVTGDVNINSQASCLVCTTEILRSMLYRGADILRDVEWVVFDECHYINDADRGVVWEEVIIMLPEHISLIFLSATVPNANELADWIGRTKKRNIFVLSTDTRPVPLEHYLYLGTNLAPDAKATKASPLEKHMFHVASSKGAQFFSESYRRVNDMLKERTKAREQRQIGSATKRSPKFQPGRGGSEASTPSSGKPSMNSKKDSKKALAGPRKANAPNARQNDAENLEQLVRGLGSNKRTQENMTEWHALLQLLKRQKLLPAVIFVFSKRKIEELSQNLGGMDLLDRREKHRVARVIREIIVGRLSSSDQRLPQVQHVCSMAYCGLGVHHSGLLPIVKEMTEVLFGEGLVKILFATETFAMGVNFPAKCVVFESLRKHDGNGFRDLTPGEYTQMSGRAGRRGKDDVGIVIIRHWESTSFRDTPLPESTSLKKMLTGKSGPLESRFRITYGMVLNLLRLSERSLEGELDEEVTQKDLLITNLLRKSFAEHDTQRFIEDTGKVLLGSLAAQEATIGDIECIADGFEPRQGSQLIGQFSADLSAASRMERGCWSRWLANAQLAQKALLPGRLVVLDASIAVNEPELAMAVGKGHWFLAVCISAAKDGTFSACVATSAATGPGICWSSEVSSVFVKTLSVESVQRVCRANLALDPDISRVGGWMKLKDAKSPSSLSVLRSLQKFGDEYLSSSSSVILPEGIDPVAELRVDDMDSVEQWEQTQVVLAQLKSSPCGNCKLLLTHLQVADQARQLSQARNGLEFVLSDDSLLLYPEFLSRLDVLEALRYVELVRDASGQVEIAKIKVLAKGQVARELNSLSSELCATEMVFSPDLLASLSAAEAAALLSTMIYEERRPGDEEDPLAKIRTLPMPTLALDDAKHRCLDIAEGLAALQIQCGVPTSTDEFIETTFNFGLVDVVFEWANGASFSSVMRSSGGNVPEGSIVRCITRLDEVCRQVANAALLVGNEQLQELMEETSSLLRRDIVFTGSLYV